MPARIHMDQEKLADFCRKHGVRKLALFGSVLRDDFGPDSDIDVLYALEEGHRIGSLSQLLEMEDALSRIMGGKRVDLVAANELNRWVAARVIHEAEVQYARG